MLKYKTSPTLPWGGLAIGLKVGILAGIGYMQRECAVYLLAQQYQIKSCRKARGKGLEFSGHQRPEIYLLV